MSYEPRILIVDDEKNFRELLKAILKKRGYNVNCAKNGFEAVKMMKSDGYDIVLTDLMMDEMDGMELIKYIKHNKLNAKCIIITAYGSIENAVEAIKEGAFSYFIKSNSPQEVIFEIEKIVKINKLSLENEILKNQVSSFEAMLATKSERFANILELAEKVARTDANVLILGESGVGKEIITRYIHQRSSRTENIIVAVNCHALSENLLESELYGHEKGSFTGSTYMRKGRFETAQGGTLFLDEIGDIPLSVQVKILRSIENKEIERIGSSTPINVDFRLICATNRDLKQEIAEKRFREDLYYRISTVTIEIPPLRDRKEDLPMLIDFFVEKSQKELKKRITAIDEGLLKVLRAYDYPGNIRELKNIIERLIVMAEGEIITLADAEKYNIFSNYNDFEVASKRSLKEVRSIAEKKHILEILHEKEYNMELAAEVLQISSRQLYNKLKEYEIKFK
ncbi:MAG: sigma-54 dependent transcriptional regulator [Proteocatella sp.]